MSRPRRAEEGRRVRAPDEPAGGAANLTIWTVGHSSRTWDEFLALLKSEGIEVVADVWRHAGSRKHPHYGSEQLPAGRGQAGIGYAPLPELGGMRRPQPDSPNTVWRNLSLQGPFKAAPTTWRARSTREAVGG